MLIKLIPPTPQPTILYNLSPPPAKDLPLPQTYQSLLHALSSSSPALDLPPTLHALDKATWLGAVLREVVFDLEESEGRVKCVWVDGGVEEWAFGMGENTCVERDREREGCIRMLERVLSDVAQSAEEDERERLRDEWEQVARARTARMAELAEANVQAQAQQAHAQTNLAKAKHKKRRSLLMSLVACVLSLFSFLPSLPH